MEGQVFVTSAVVFSALIVIAALPSGPQLQRSGDLNGFFSTSLDSVSEKFDAALATDSSPQYVERELYSHLGFLERISEDRSVDFDAYTVGVFPGREEAFVLNYGREKRSFRVKTSESWENFTLGPRESRDVSLSPEPSNLSVITSEATGDFQAYTPRVHYWLSMTGSGQSWQNTRTR